MTRPPPGRFGAGPDRWLAANCGRCSGEEACPLRRALLGALQTRTALAAATADRLGVPRDGLFGAWTCREFDLARAPSRPSRPEEPDAPAA